MHRQMRDPDADGWEKTDFPILCETCLGPNPYIRMTKEQYGRECKICTRPFTIFRWKPGNDARYKKTEVCQTCSKAKNVCQVCLLDLEYGLPVQVRDQALGLETNQLAKSDVNREYQAEAMDQQAAQGIDFDSHYGKAKKNELLSKLQRSSPYYARNRSHICSFFVRGDCTRGTECPYRHEMPTTGPLAEQNMKDRYYGVNDPVAAKMMQRASEMPTLAPPPDPTITTLYVGGLEPTLGVTEQDLQDTFYGYGEVQSVRLITDRKCAFVTYATRAGAEKAAAELCNALVLKGSRCKLMWGKPSRQQGQLPPADGAGASTSGGVPPPQFLPPQMRGGMGPPPMMMGGMGPPGVMGGPPPGMNYFNLPPPMMGMMAPPGMMGGMMPPMAPGVSRTFYPSMNPNMMGTFQGQPGGGGGGPPQ